MSDQGRVDRGAPSDPTYDYRRECGMPFESAVEAVEQSLARHGFSVRVIHDIQATLAAKGFRVRPIRIYEVDAPRDPAAGGTHETPPHMAHLMPCRINVFEEAGEVVITVLRPTLLCKLFPEDHLDEAASALERVLIAVVDEAVC